MKRFSESTLASQYAAGVQCTDAFACFGDTEGEVQVHTQVLRIASPVFDAMFSSGMMEDSSKRFRIEIASKTDFVSFYNCLLPGASCAQHVTPENVDGILELRCLHSCDEQMSCIDPQTPSSQKTCTARPL